MVHKTPRGYEEVGKSIAQAVAEGFMTKSFANELASLSGYGWKTCSKWIEHYRSLHAGELARLERRSEGRARQVEALRRQSEAIRRKGLDRR